MCASDYADKHLLLKQGMTERLRGERREAEAEKESRVCEAVYSPHYHEAGILVSVPRMCACHLQRQL